MITNEEVKEIFDLAVKCWHEVAEEHKIKPCNCFRENFGKSLILKYNLPLYKYVGSKND